MAGMEAFLGPHSAPPQLPRPPKEVVRIPQAIDMSLKKNVTMVCWSREFCAGLPEELRKSVNVLSKGTDRTVIWR